MVAATLCVAATVRAQVPATRGNGASAQPAFARCDKATLLLKDGGADLGRETFETRCAADGSVSGTGHTTMKAAGMSIEGTTAVELDPSLLPRKMTAHMVVNGTTQDVTMTFSDTGATMVTAQGTMSMPYTKGQSLIGNNVFYLMPLVGARYDMAKGGVQQIPAMGGIAMTLEPRGRDDVRLAGAAAAVPFYRWRVDVATQTGTAWTDARGRLAAFSLPSQKVTLVREEYAPYLQALDSMRVRSASPATTPDYGAPAGASFTAEEVTIPVRTYKLAGTLLVPKTGRRPFPAAVMITGSGQQTRDEAIPIPGLEQYRPFRQIAETLASAGIAVLRVDDRAVGGSTGRETLDSATSSSFADDTRAQVAFLRARPEIDGARIALIGHSEGGIIAPMVAASDPRIAAIVLLAGTATRGDTILFGQMDDALSRDTAMSASQKQSARDGQRIAIETIRAGGTVPGVNGARWLREFVSYDPVAAIRKVKQPILILQGEYDRQVPASEAPILERAAKGAGNRDVTMRIFPTLNHLFLPSTTGAFSEYGSLKQTAIGDDVLASLRDWLAARLLRK